MNIQKYSNDLKRFVIPVDSTILQAMQAINDNWREIVFVQDASCRIVGVITDGDIRRGLLSGLTLDAPALDVMNPEFLHVRPDLDRAAILDMMKATTLRQIPALDNDGRLVGIHFLNDLLGMERKPNSALIMAGGKGMRLRPLTENCPKPMIKVAGRPILERVVHHLVGYGIRKIFLAINYLGDVIEAYFRDGSQFGCSIDYLREDRPLGTGGALSLMPEDLEHPLIVMNGDQITQVNITKLLEFHDTNKFEATIGVKNYQVEIPFGVVEEKDGKLKLLREKPIENFLINTGIYILNPDTLSLVPKNENFPITSLFERYVSKNSSAIGVYYIDEDWIDVGRVDELRRANGII